MKNDNRNTAFTLLVSLFFDSLKRHPLIEVTFLFVLEVSVILWTGIVFLLVAYQVHDALRGIIK